MIFSFFTPETKVHKQRNLLRDTDFRMARYSRRGLALSLVIFSISMYLGIYYKAEPKMALILAMGLLITTLVRGYYLFRFDAIYARAPTRWRNIYFVITIISGAWWGFMLAMLTYEIGLAYETPLLWFYTVAFFSSGSHVFSPFQKFYRVYIFITLLPCSVVAMLSLHAIDSIYGVIMLVLLYLLQRQGGEQGDAYWKRLQATYDLTQRANALEAEKITSLSSLSDKDTLFVNFAGELKTSLKEILGSLQLLRLAKLPDQEEQLVVLAEQKSQQQMHMLQNVLEFSHISRKEIRLHEDVVDLRSILEKAVASVSDSIYKKHMEIFVRFSSEFPQRVRGDGDRLQQIIINMIMGAMDYANGGCLLLDVHYTGSVESVGSLKVIAKLDKPLRTPEIEQSLHDAFKPHYANNVSQGLQLAIAKGLAICMQGSAGANYTQTEQLHFWFAASLATVTPANSASQAMIKLNGKRLLLYQPPQIIEDEYKNTLESWGFLVDIFYDYESVIAAIRNAQQTGLYFDLLMIYTRIDDLEGVALARQVAEEFREKTMPQLICITEMQSKLPVVEQLLNAFPNVSLLHKPIGYKQLRQRFKQLLLDDNFGEETATTAEDFLNRKQILLLQAEDIDRTIAEVMLKKLGCDVTAVLSSDDVLENMQEYAYDAVIIDSRIKDVDMREFIDKAKAYSEKAHDNAYIAPIFGLSQNDTDGEETRCLQCGMDYFIDSPLQVDDLRAILRRWIGRAEHMAQQRRDSA